MRERVLFSDLSTLYICPSQRWGTLERKALNDCLIQRDFGGNPVLFCLKDSKLDEEAKKWDITTIYYTGNKVRSFFDLTYYLNLKKILKTINFDVIHCYSLNYIWEACFLLMTKPQIPLLFTFNDYLNDAYKNYFQRWLFKRVDQVLVFSQIMKEVVQETLPVSNRKIKISGNGVESFKKLEVNKLKRKDINCIVSSIEDLEQVKTFIYAIKALKEHVEKLDLEINLNVFSITKIEKFENYETVIQQVHDNNLSELIHFNKIKEDIEAFQNADVFIGTAFNEPFNDYEMMAILAKVPVLLPRTASRQSLLNKYKWTGESYYYSDPREVKVKLLKILTNDQVYLNELSDQHQSFKDNHGIDSYITRLCGFYEKNYSKRMRFNRSRKQRV
jgi:glycosyltransferase involved in cell wall biosynthesis